MNICCEKCGKPLVKTNKYGMFCVDDCFLEESKKIPLENMCKELSENWENSEFDPEKCMKKYYGV